jgi:hypothetical protein
MCAARGVSKTDTATLERTRPLSLRKEIDTFEHKFPLRLFTIYNPIALFKAAVQESSMPTIWWAGWCSWYDNYLDGLGSIPDEGEVFYAVQTCPEPRTSPLYEGYGVFQGRKATRA